MVLASLIMSWSATSRADRPGEPNIPGSEQKNVAAATDVDSAPPSSTPRELPPPYAPWQGTGFGPPGASAAVDLPTPLARPRQQARRKFEVAAALALFLPNCGSGSIDDRGCLTVGAGAGADLTLLYRVSPFFAVGAQGVLSGFGAAAEASISSSTSGGGSRFLGVVGRVYFADDGAWDPYVALTLGAGTLDLRGQEPGATRRSTTGFGGRVEAGIDYAFGSHFRLGPTASFAHWVAWSERSCKDNICREAPALFGKLVGFASFGLRVTGSFGDVL